MLWVDSKELSLGEDEVKRMLLGKDVVKRMSLGEDEGKKMSLGEDVVKRMSLGEDEGKKMSLGKDVTGEADDESMCLNRVEVSGS